APYASDRTGAAADARSGVGTANPDVAGAGERGVVADARDADPDVPAGVPGAAAAPDRKVSAGTCDSLAQRDSEYRARGNTQDRGPQPCSCVSSMEGRWRARWHASGASWVRTH